MTTKLSPRQMYGEHFNSIREELKDIKLRTGYINGLVYSKQDLPNLVPEENDLVFVIGDNIYVRFRNGIWEDVAAGDVGVSDPQLDSRVSALETQTSTLTEIFTEDFITKNLIDNEKTNAAIGGGYVRTARIPSFQEEFDDLNNMEAGASTNVELTGTGALKMADGTKSAVYMSKQIPVHGPTRVRLDANVTHRSTMSFQSTENTFPGEPEVYNTMTLKDRMGRQWYVGFTASKMLYRIEDVFGATLFSGSHPMGYSVRISNDVEMEATFDYENNLWIGIVTLDGGRYHRSLIGSFTSSGGVHKAFEELYYLSNTSISRALFSTSLITDRENKIWMVSSLGYSGFGYVIYNSDGTVFRPWELINGSSGAASSKIVYDSIRDQMIIFQTRSTTSIYAQSYDLNGNPKSSLTTISASGHSMHHLSAHYSEEHDRVFVFATSGYTTEEYPLLMFVINPATLAIENRFSLNVNGLRQVHHSPLSMIVEGNIARIAMSSNLISSTFTNIYYAAIELNPDTPIILEQAHVTTSTTNNYTHPWIAKDRGRYVILYASIDDGNRVAKRAIFTSISTEVKFAISRDNGVNWFPVKSSEYVNLGAAAANLRVRIELKSPFGVAHISPEILNYELTEFDSATNELRNVFVSQKLPSVKPIAHVTLTANQALNSGVIEWFVSNNGGLSWDPVVPGVKHTFENAINADLRVRANLISPYGETVTPIITSYTIVSANAALVSDLRTIEINLMKTNFKLATMANATRYALTDMIVDDFLDTSGLDASSSNIEHDATEKKIHLADTGVPGIAVSLQENLSHAPKKFMIVVDETLNTGSIEYEVSRNGSSWTRVKPEQVTDISMIPTGTRLTVRAKITGNATLNAWSYSWK